MKILTVNSGSSSLKFKLFDLNSDTVLAQGKVEKIGEEISLFSFRAGEFEKDCHHHLIPNHEKAIQMIIDHLTDPQYGVIKQSGEIQAVGHRLVHGGEFYSDSVVIDDEVIDALERCSTLAPLHNPAGLKGIYAVKHLFPDLKQCGIFDTAFHQTIPSRAFLYALPLEYYTKHKIRRYGFHGTSHKFVCRMAAEYLNKNVNDLKIVSCHIGNGASVTAVYKGKSIDTSMGFTPLEGLVMGTRCGDIDPAIIIHMQKNLGLTVEEVNSILNNRSGILGLSSLSNDMRVIEEEVLEKKNSHAIQALGVYTYRIKKYIGAYAAAMNGIDVLIFTGGVGENMPVLRAEVCRDMDFLGIVLDESGNNQAADDVLEIQKTEGRVTILKIPADEELMIARESSRFVEK
jgi:acetate kinase